MFRTTIGLKDEINSDTVSTEFNYLNQFPISRKIELKQRSNRGSAEHDREVIRNIIPQNNENKQIQVHEREIFEDEKQENQASEM